ncbi:MAG: AbrB/MazE/SpoVT family DNA-binding domain-containing protein [Thiolinea sp.]
MQTQIAKSDQRQVRLFRNGRNQAIRIPREFELPGEEAILRREGGKLIIEAVPVTPLLSFLKTCEPLDIDFPDVDDLPPLDDVDL